VVCQGSSLCGWLFALKLPGELLLIFHSSLLTKNHGSVDGSSPGSKSEVECVKSLTKKSFVSDISVTWKKNESFDTPITVVLFVPNNWWVVQLALLLYVTPCGKLAMSG